MTPGPSRETGGVLVVSCYELGRAPLAAATAAAFLERAGFVTSIVDLAVEPMATLDSALAQAPDLVAVSVPMHTALHVGVRAAARIREQAPAAHLTFFGLYATLNSEHLLSTVCDSTIGGEVEPVLIELISALQRKAALDDLAGLASPGRPAGPWLARLDFPLPSRAGLPPAERYARLVVDGEERTAAAVETSRGCLHICRHCPITPIYGGRFFVVPREVVLEDIRRLAAAGVRHISFADPDFLNGPGHSMAVVRAMHRAHPGLTFDATIKVEHLLARRDLLPELAASGCLFIVSAVEALSNQVLEHLRKGHTRNDVFEALALARRVGIALRPSFVAFTPWTTIGDYCDVLDWILDEALVDHVDPVQLSIRLLVPPGSPLVELDVMQPHLRGLAPASFAWRWEHPDPRMDRLAQAVGAIVADAARSGEDAARTFERIGDAAGALSGREQTIPHPTRIRPGRERSRPPRMTEPWFC